MLLESKKTFLNIFLKYFKKQSHLNDNFLQIFV